MNVIQSYALLPAEALGVWIIMSLKSPNLVEMRVFSASFSSLCQKESYLQEEQSNVGNQIRPYDHCSIGFTDGFAVIILKKLGKQDASNLYTISPPRSQVLSARVPQAAGGQGRNLGIPPLSEYQNGAVSSPGDTSSSAQLHMPSNGARNEVVATNGGHNGRAHGTRVMENGNNHLNTRTGSVSPRM